MPAAPKRKPSKSDVSRPGRQGDYAFKKGFYRDSAVAEDYDFHRLGSPRRARRNVRKWRAIRKGLALTEGVRSILDMPCGTGRFTGPLASCGYEVIGSDISFEMMQVARDKGADAEQALGFMQADAEQLPLPDQGIDCVVCIRFMFHIDPPTRVRILREMGRVARWIVIDYRHRYTLRYLVRALRLKLGLTRDQLPRVSRAELRQEFGDAGLRIIDVIPVSRFSDKWIVVAEPASCAA